MRQEVFQQLLNINKEFYQSFGQAFAQTRRRVQPGVRQVLEAWITDGDWLDIGCGGGVLAQAWRNAGLKGSYTGVDFSDPLLTEARGLTTGLAGSADLTISFNQVDLAAENWTEALPLQAFDGAISFAALHHIPSAEYRQRLLNAVARLLKPGGLFIHSAWQFQHSPKLLARVQPWGLVDLADHDVEQGDTLLDWRYHPGGTEGAPGLRYVHLFTPAELLELTAGAGFEIISEFESDGSGGRLGLYQVWRRKGL